MRLSGFIPYGILILAFTLSSLSFQDAGARKIRQSLKVKTKKSGNTFDQMSPEDNLMEINVDGRDSIIIDIDGSDHIFRTDEIKFAGYDKDISANRESFHIINQSGHTLREAKITIIYKDMDGRMLHKRDTSIKCDIPAGETRKTDIPTWDLQHSFYYHLSNAPRRVASPYQIQILPLSFSIIPEFR